LSSAGRGAADVDRTDDSAAVGGNQNVIETTLEVRFPADDEASVLLRSTGSGQADKQAELILFCLYAARAIANLRQTDAARALVRSLAAFEQATVDEVREFVQGDGPRTGTGDEINVVFAPPDQAFSNDKSFHANVRYIGEESNPRIFFTMKPRGFGLLGKGVDYYAPGSVLVLLYSLFKRREEDESYLRRLARAAGLIGQLAAADKYAFGNQMDVAVAAADLGWHAAPISEEIEVTGDRVADCPACGNTELDYRVWPSETESIRRCRRCGAGLWIQDGAVRMISSDTWLGIEEMRAWMSEAQVEAASEVEEEAVEEPSQLNGVLFLGLKKVFSDYRWPFSEVPGMPVLLSELSGPLGSWTFYAQIVEEQDLIVFYSVCPLTVPEPRRVEVADFLTRANYGLALGNFELDFEDGEIRYKTVLEVEGGRISPDLVKRLVKANGLAMETYLPGIGAVVTGTPAVPALDRLTAG
jgi:hypothetical protein